MTLFVLLNSKDEEPLAPAKSATAEDKVDETEVDETEIGDDLESDVDGDRSESAAGTEEVPSEKTLDKQEPENTVEESGTDETSVGDETEIQEESGINLFIWCDCRYNIIRCFNRFSIGTLKGSLSVTYSLTVICNFMFTFECTSCFFWIHC